jgi:hypothetical protein
VNIIATYHLQELIREINFMDISQKESATNGFKKWSTAHAAPINDDDLPGGATTVALAASPQVTAEDLRAVAKRR